MVSCEEVPPPEAYGPTPTTRQLEWQEMEYYAFIHFSINTFTDIEWGYGDKDPKLFNPTELDTKQWAKVIKEAGMKGIIITAKHHDGFCLWPSKYTDYSVKNSPWRDGKGDLLKELSEACKEYGLKFGVYLSPWDRNHPQYGKPEYITYFRNQLKELLTNYGEVFEVWFDGANGGSGYYGGANETRSVDRKTYYDWENTYKIVRELQPNAMLFSDAGPDTRWCGTEEGWVGETNWSTLNRDEVWPGFPDYHELRYGHEDGTHWVPAEVDVSVRPGWFYHRSEDHKVKTLPEMLDIYYNSVGRNATLLLNFPVDKRGLIHETDVNVVTELAESLKEDFKNNLAKKAKIQATQIRGGSSLYNPEKLIDGHKDTYWTTDDNVTKASVTLSYDKSVEFNRLLVQEHIELGQRVQEFSIEAYVDSSWKKLGDYTTIGYKRILRLPTVKASQIRISINKSKACPVLSNLELYKAPKVYTKPIIKRDKQGMVRIENADNELDIFYTLDGNEPDKGSLKYNGPFTIENKAIIKAVSIDPITSKRSPVASRSFDIARKKWNILEIEDENALKVMDGEENTSWGQSANKLPIDLKIDLGENQKIRGFKYLPDQNRWSSGIIIDYKFYTSNDGENWELQSVGEFSNIKNSPIWQTKTFEAVNARYIKLSALRNTDGNFKAGYAEINIITE